MSKFLHSPFQVSNKIFINVLSINMTSLCLNSFQTFLTSLNFTQCFSSQTLLLYKLHRCCCLRRFAPKQLPAFIGYAPCCENTRNYFWRNYFQIDTNGEWILDMDGDPIFELPDASYRFQGIKFGTSNVMKDIFTEDEPKKKFVFVLEDSPLEMQDEEILKTRITSPN